MDFTSCLALQSMLLRLKTWESTLLRIDKENETQSDACMVSHRGGKHIHY